MSIDSVTSTATSGAENPPTTARSGTSSTTQLDYNAFLQLLMAEMKNQDPLEPQKSSEYVAQLATFSQVEKSVQMNDRMTELLSTVRLQQAEGLIGKTVTSADGSLRGTVVSTKVVGQDVQAILNDGRQLVVNSGVTISGGPGA